jgi:hypothetical protein
MNFVRLRKALMRMYNIEDNSCFCEGDRLLLVSLDIFIK